MPPGGPPLEEPLLALDPHPAAKTENSKSNTIEAQVRRWIAIALARILIVTNFS